MKRVRVALAAACAMGMIVAAAPAAFAARSHDSTSHGFHEGYDSVTGVSWRMDYGWDEGSDAFCTVPSSRDGWTCQSHVPHWFQFAGAAWGYSGYSDVEHTSVSILRASSNNPQYALWVGGSNNFCSTTFPPETSYCYVPAGSSYTTHVGSSHDSTYREWSTPNGGCYWVRLYWEAEYGSSGYRNYDTGAKIIGPYWTQCFDDLVTTPPPNAAPSITLVSPAGGATLRREHALATTETLTISASDPNGHNWTGLVEVSRNSSFTDIVYSVATPKASSGQQVSVDVDLAKFKQNRTFYWRAKATDTAGGSHTKESGWASRSFTYVFSSPPSVPAPVAPAAGALVLLGHPQVFAVTATDPEATDAWRAEFEIRNASNAVVESFASASAPGSIATATSSAILPPGAYTWTAVAVDEHGQRSGSSAPRTFFVL